MTILLLDLVTTGWSLDIIMCDLYNDFELCMLLFHILYK